ncbi:hypothetical protein HHK36_007211 [Tetracentron sinense]|uniref:Pentatricopeptide repeat-containing protein n=1 Tax=Tetracentron sinense TaxID=13715 RepID=A0A834ZM84_TETSI|nr:hypothetical protein HHK36_007211 [Tetracentron sinense]
MIKTISHKIKANLSQLPSTVPTAKYPFQDLLSLLQKCKARDHLNQIHAQMISTGLIHNPLVATKLVVSFASSHLPGTTSVARLIAGQVDRLDTYTWNTIIRGYLEEKNPKEAILVYAHVRRTGLNVDSYTLLFVIKACGLISGILQGEGIHGHIFKMGFVSEIITQTGLLSMYGLFEKLESAQKVFDESSQRDSVHWNALVSAYAQRNYPYKVFLVCHDMVTENVKPNGVTAVCMLSACSCLRALREGKLVHGYVLKNLIDLDVFIYNALINMYSKCGHLINAHRIFQKMPTRNLVSWTSMINGYSNNNYPNEALALFKEMESANIRPDEVTILGVVSMCLKLRSIKLEEWIDNYVEKNGFWKSISIANALMDMHAKCGNIKKACQIFDRMEEKTLVSWTTLIQGLALHGHGIPALVRFCQMQREGFRPDSIVFLSILSACSHSGLVDEGRKCFQIMIEDHDATPLMEHYGCMVDLLCRAGLVNEAFKFVESMEVKPDIMIWRMLLGACKNQGDISLASQVMDRLLELEPEYSGNYILLSNLHATLGEWDNVREVRTEMGIRGVIKRDPGCSLIEVN